MALCSSGLLLLGALTPGHAQTSPEGAPPLDLLIANLQARYDQIRDFEARFEHRYTSDLLRTSVVERGTVLIKKPRKMRWSYTEPEEKLFVSDGHTLYSYFPIDAEVLVADIPSTDRASTPILFLAGEGRLAADFTAMYEPEPRPPADTPATWTVRLTPTIPEADYAWLALTVERTTLQILGLTATDHQGGRSEFVFSDLRENQDIPDRMFTFDVPDDATVITESGRTLAP